MIEASTSDSAGERGGRDETAVSQFVERFSSILVEAGWPRMPARAFVTLLAGETSALTAADLAERLRVSPAAISGAVRYLLQLDLVSRDREPGSRRDVFRVEDDVWYHVISRRIMAMTKWGDQLNVGLAAVGSDSPAADRLAEMIDFFEFLQVLIPEAMERWRAKRGTR
ncbi:MAG TPA: MarR family transcriptional regulator [Pseudonocardiaceae bacterium]|nr:MarR family transcriptional regulator [Pseudonocardiaceae bacterium]